MASSSPGNETLHILSFHLSSQHSIDVRPRKPMRSFSLGITGPRQPIPSRPRPRQECRRPQVCGSNEPNNLYWLPTDACIFYLCGLKIVCQQFSCLLFLLLLAYFSHCVFVWVYFYMCEWGKGVAGVLRKHVFNFSTLKNRCCQQQ